MEDIEIESLIEKYPNLKRQSTAGVNFLEPWTKANLADGFRKFFDDYGRHPTAEEIDTYEYLPSSRQIQRAFGGLRKLRQGLGLPITDFGAGENRVRLSSLVGKRGLEGEREIESLLIDRFGEHYVHIEKPLFKYFPTGSLYKNKLRGDFFVYHRQGQFVVDVFFAQNKNSINANLNIKRKKYEDIQIKTYFVILHSGEQFSQDMIEHTINGKKNKLDKNITTLNKDTFTIELLKYEPLKPD